MKDGARVQLTLDLWERYTYEEPADRYIHMALKNYRFVGSKDRKNVRDLFFYFMRRETFLRDQVQSLSAIVELPQEISLTRLMYILDKKDLGKIYEWKEIFTGEGYDPAPLTAFEQKVLGLPSPLPSATSAGALSLSPFWWEKLKEEFGDSLEHEAQAFGKEAPTDLRVNTLKLSRSDALSMLRRKGFEISPTTFSPHGLRIRWEGHVPLQDFILNGDLEPQDEGSQLIAMMVDARSGMRVLDYCAGAGGKTLSLAMQMENKGTLIASDVSENRLKRSTERLKRLGIHNATTLIANGKWRKKQSGTFDRVLIDAPCSGSGTWRRNPDLMLRTNASDIAELVEKQREILKETAPLVKEGGRLIYATCSLIQDENDHQVKWFLEHYPEFHLLPLTDIWNTLPFSLPPPPSDENIWKLTSSKHHTDGFFMACFEREK